MRRISLLMMIPLLVLAVSCGSNESSDSDGFDLDDDVGLEDAGGADAGDDATQQGAELGEACTEDGDCVDGRCITDEPFDGYCTTEDGCRFDTECPDGTSCYSSPDGAICASRCSGDADCRDGYVCKDSPASPFDVCVPFVEPTGVDDGEPCQSDDECRGGTCIPSPGWPDGYCTTLDCETRDDCAADGNDNRCLTGGRGYNLCVRMCDTQDDCRDGYICQQVGGGNAFCSPDQSVQLGLEGLDEYPYDITCGLANQNGSISVDYEIAEDTVSYMITPLARDGNRISPTQISLPDGTISFTGENDFQRVPSQLFGFINPILTPVIDNFVDQLQAGQHTLELDTQTEDLCYYLLEEDTVGTTIDFNVYLAGVPGLDAAAAADDPNMEQVLAKFDEMYAQSGIEIDQVRFHDITGEDADAYQVIRTETDLQRLVSLSERPEGDYDAALSANIFFVQSMELGGMGGGGGAIGVSQGLPGAAGLHGTPSSGVVFTSEYMGQDVQTRSGDTVDGNDFTGIVLAHEVGHYLGLFHTTEQFDQGFDPIDDTPECTSGFPEDCPDLDNLMFPLADITHTEITDGQSFTIKSNPLTKD